MNAAAPKVSGAIDSLSTKLFGGPGPAAQDAQEALAQDRAAQAKLRQQQMDKIAADLTAQKEAKEQAAGAPAAFVSNFGVPPQQTMDYIQAKPVQPVPETAEQPGIMGGYATPAPEGLTPDKENVIRETLKQLALMPAMSGKTNLPQLQDAVGRSTVNNAVMGAGTDPKALAIASSIAGASQGKPFFHEGAAGDTMGVYSGVQDQSAPLPQAKIDVEKAQAAAQRSLVPLHGAQAREANLRGEKVRTETLPQVQVPNPIPGGPPTLPATGRDASKAALGTAGGVGGAGAEMYQDPTTGKKYEVNKRAATAHLMQDDGTWQAVNPNTLPNNLQKVGNVGAAGSRENVYIGRIGLAASEATRDLENVAKLPLTASTGLFGGRKQGPGLLDATREVLGNTVTGQEAQSYNVKATGFQRNLAAIEAAGLMPTGTLTHQMDAVMWKEGDTQLTKLQKLAQTRQIIDAGLDHVLANPRVSESEKAKLNEYRARMAQAVPFDHAALDGWAAAQESNPDLTLRQFLGTRQKAPAAPAAGAARGGVKFLGFE